MTELDLVRVFVEGNVQNRFIVLADKLDDFIRGNAPILEKVNANIDWYNTLPLGKATSTAMINFYRADTEQAKKGLSIYNRMFGMIDFNRAMAASNFGLPQFLAENGLPKSQIEVYQTEIRQYWKETYGAISDKFGRCMDPLQGMRATLQTEIDWLEQIPSLPHLEAYDREKALNKLFEKERDAFYVLVKEWKKDENFNDAVENARALCQSQLFKLKEWGKNAVVQFREGLRVEETMKTGQKFFIVSMYTLGALYTVLTIRQTLIKKTFGFAMEHLKLYMEAKNIKMRAAKLQEGAHALLKLPLEKVADRATEAVVSAAAEKAVETIVDWAA